MLLREFVEMIDAPVFLNSMGRGSIPSDHPNLASTGRRYALVNADAILLIGTPIDFRLSFGRDVLFNKGHLENRNSHKADKLQQDQQRHRRNDPPGLP